MTSVEKNSATIGTATVSFVDRGEGPPILFIHGFPTSSLLWTNAIDLLQARYRCIAPDLMGLGDTASGDNEDLSPPAQAMMISGLMDRLGVKDAVVVAHDQGGAAAQIMAMKFPERVRGLVLIDIVCFDNWPAPGVKSMRAMARIPLLGDWITGSAALRRLANAIGGGLKGGFFDKSKASREIVEECISSVSASPERRRRFKKYLLAGDSRYTMEIAPELEKLSMPALIIWGRNDPHLPIEWAEKLARHIPGAAGPEIIEECGHFAPWEKPERVAKLIDNFIGAQKDRVPPGAGHGL